MTLLALQIQDHAVLFIIQGKYYLVKNNKGGLTHKQNNISLDE